MPSTRSMQRLQVTQNVDILPENRPAENGRDNTGGPNKVVWTPQLRRDLISCYNDSEPNNRNYMERLYNNWITIHPELNYFSKVTISNQLAYIKKHPKPEDDELTQSSVQAETAREEDPEINELKQKIQSSLVDTIEDRKKRICYKQFIKEETFKKVNSILEECLNADLDIWNLNRYVYATACALIHRKSKNKLSIALENRIKKLDVKIKTNRQLASRIQSVIDNMIQNKRRTKKIGEIIAMMRRNGCKINKADLKGRKEKVVDKIKALSAARRKISERKQRVDDNELFSNNPSAWMKGKDKEINEVPSKEQVEDYWEGLYSKSATFNKYTPAIEAFQKYCKQKRTNTIETIQITEEDVKKALKGTKSFSAPGPDGICNYWWKKLVAVHKHLAEIYNRLLNGSLQAPDWFVAATTTLIYKKGDLRDPSNYRPITCLNTMYKVFTKILNNKILYQIHPIWSQIHEQRGAKKNMQGCKESLSIDRCVCEDAKKYKRNLSVAWVDFRKAFDSTPHDLIIFILKTLNIHPQIISCIENLMCNWKTKFKIKHGGKETITKPIIFKRGVFQGDSLSPLLFCLTLVPLTIQLRQHKGYSCGRPSQRVNYITHLLYMDDLKIYMGSKEELQQALNDVSAYTQDISMEFGAEKCSVMHIKRGSIEGYGSDTELVDGTIIRHLQPNNCYTYLGIEQNSIHDAKQVKDKAGKKYKEILRKIWDSGLSAKNKVNATNMLAIPQISFTFAIIKWAPEELRQLDRYTRKIMTVKRSHHPRASVPRLYLPRREGGRGLLSIETLHNKIVLKTYHYILNSEDPLIKIVREHEQQGSLLSNISSKALEHFNLDIRLNTNELRQRFRSITVRELETMINKNKEEQLRNEHTTKILHGKYFRVIQEHNLSVAQSFVWLRSSTLRSETEGFLMSVQDGVCNTLIYRSTILKQNIENAMCRRCKQNPETLNHLLSSCPVYAATAYSTRHNAALKVLYFHIRHRFGIDETPVIPYTVHDVEAVCSNSNIKIYWNFQFATSVRITANKPDLVVEDLKTKNMCIVELSCPLEVNVNQKEDEKKNKYKDLIFELKKRVPQSKIKFVTIIIGVLGGVKSNVRESIRTIPGCDGYEDQLFKNMQQQVILGSLHLLRGHEAAYT